jgi:hypothetical protein
VNAATIFEVYETLGSYDHELLALRVPPEGFCPVAIEAGLRRYHYIRGNNKVKAKLFPCLKIQHHIIKTYGGNESIAPPFLTSALG